MADVVRRRIALLIAAFAVPGMLVLFSEAGPAPGRDRVLAFAVLCSTIPVAAAVFAARKSFRWWRKEQTQRNVALAFTIYADLGTAAFLLLCRDRPLSLAGCALFAVISSYVAFFAGRATVIAHMAITSAVLAWIVFLVISENPIGAVAAIAAAAAVWLAVNATMTIVNSTSISLHRQLEKQIGHSQTDPLTGLLNLRGLEATAHRRVTPEQRVGFLLIDLDHFKHVNDRFGHLAGDAVLALAATRLRDFIGDNGLVARRGGEEFLVVVDATDVNPHELACNARVALSDPSDHIPVSVSIGVSVLDASQFESGDTGSVVNTGMHLADIAMYRAKSAGRNTVVMFDAPAG
ncbi:MAG: diguanylate cyclase, partial [Rhodococcus sp. (in: high G+C Gram-positive bacteria)]